MGFNYQGAFAGLLGEFGRQSQAAASRMQEIQDKQEAENRKDRREMARLTKIQALKTLGWDESGKPWTSEEFQAAEDKPILKSTPEAWDKKAELEQERQDKIIGRDESGRPWTRKEYFDLPEGERPDLYENAKSRKVATPKGQFTQKELFDAKNKINEQYQLYTDGFGKKSKETPLTKQQWVVQEYDTNTWNTLYGGGQPILGSGGAAGAGGGTSDITDEDKTALGDLVKAVLGGPKGAKAKTLGTDTLKEEQEEKQILSSGSEIEKTEYKGDPRVKEAAPAGDWVGKVSKEVQSFIDRADAVYEEAARYYDQVENEELPETLREEQGERAILRSQENKERKGLASFERQKLAKEYKEVAKKIRDHANRNKTFGGGKGMEKEEFDKTFARFKELRKILGLNR
jgi:hypothetical protein